MVEKNSGIHEGYCPFLGLEYEQCYTVQMTSQAIPKILKFCAGDYENCDVYTQLFQRAK